ncbi:MAG: flagellar biosynthesis protein FlhF [Deltaproteobacteria bacterium]|nr:flagellar biosynthesis protein FlhF [Deltaproteobacteria bacterium]
MQTKSFRAPTMKDAIALVKAELGPEAVILTTRSVRSHKGLLGRVEIEITAAPDPQRAARAAKAAEPAANSPEISTTAEPRPDDLARRLAALESSGAVDALRARVDRMGEQLDDVTRLLARLTEAGEVPAVAEVSAPVAPAVSRVYESILARLVDRGVAVDLARDIVAEAACADFEADEFEVLPHIAGAIMNRIKVKDPFAGAKGQTVCALVGPTGVGKTTTLAKLAAGQVLDRRKRAAFLTVDTFRVGAVEQLRVYGRIMDVPVEIAGDERDLAEKIARHADKDVIFVDTAGVGQKDRMMLNKMAAYFAGNARFETHLIVSATTQYRDLADIAEQFRIFSPSSLIASKLDESNALGGVFTLAATHAFPLSWFTIGQQVPDDIEPATAERVVDQLLGITAH